MSQKKSAANLQDNPIVNPPETKFNMPAWDQIKPEHFVPAMEWAIEKTKANIAAIKAVPLSDASFENTIEAYEACAQDVMRVLSITSYYKSNAFTDEIVALQNQISNMLSPVFVGIGSDEDLYQRIKAVYDDKSGLNDVQTRLTELTYKEFEEGPLSLSAEQREEYLAIQEKLTEKSSQFGQNLAVHSDAKAKDGLKIVVKKDEIAERLDGVNESLIAFFTDKESGDVIIGAIPESFDIIEECHNRETRRLIQENYTARGNKGAQNNDQLVSEIHQLKQQMAQLFGYKNIVEKTIRPDNRAAGTPENVWNILHRMRDVGYRASVDVYDKALSVAKADGITTIDADADDAVKLQPWDVAYYLNIVSQQEGGIDPAEEKKYFNVPDVVDGLTRSMKRRFGITLEETQDFEMPSEDMQVYYSKTPSGKVNGIFIVDLYQRADKRGGAWMDQMRPAGMVDGEWQVPITLVNCNYAVDKAKQYISFDSVTTLYHEWGHATHGHSSQKTPYQTLNSIDIAWDAVELPSQFNEKFAEHRRHFNSYARHAETGKTMPKALYDKLMDKKPDLQILRQNQFGWLDMEMYSTTDKISSMSEFNKASFGRTALIVDKNSDNAMVNGFSHIVSGGYSAGYYSYLYANFMVSAMEDLFDKHGQKAVTAFKREFVSVGCTKDASEAFDNVYRALGEEVKPLSPDAFLRKEGYGKYIDAADAEGTSGESVPFSVEYKRPKMA
jgi:peptidyl-dipeptidase Dcp